MLTRHDLPTGTCALQRVDSRWRFWIPLAAILIYAAVLRLYALDSYPALFNQDEMALGYDAWSIWTTGRDQHGQLLPVHFHTFDDYVPPVANYLTAPFVGLLGLTEFSTRLPVALASVITILLVALLGRGWFGAIAGLLAALFFSMSSWHINYSRVAFPASYVPFFTTAALYTYTRGVNNLQSRPEQRGSIVRWLGASSICFALLTAAYPTMKIQGPLLLAACALASAPLLRQRRRLAAGWIAFYLLCLSPLLLDQLARWDVVQARFQSESALNYPAWPLQVMRLYTQHYNPASLIFEGFEGGIAQRPPYVGELFWLDAPLGIAAFVGLSWQSGARQGALSLPILLGIWFFTFPVASSLTEGAWASGDRLGTPHEIRAINFLPLPQLLAGYGAAVIWQTVPRYRRLAAGGLALGMAALVIGFNALFIPYYFRESTEDPPYNSGLRPALELVSSVATPCDVIWLDNTRQAYIYYLFLTKYPPQRFQRFAADYPQAGHVFIPRFDRVRFGTPDEIIEDPSLDLACQDQPYRAFYVTRTAFMPPDWQELHAFPTEASSSLWRVVATDVAAPPRPPSEVEANVTFGGEITLLEYNLENTTVAPGDTIHFTPNWTIMRQPSSNYSMFVHLYPEDEIAILAQDDGALTADARPTLMWDNPELLYPGRRVSLTVPSDLEPGAYRLAVGLYDYVTGERLKTEDDSEFLSIIIEVN